MARVKKGTVRIKKRKAILGRTKGYKWGAKNLTKRAKETTKKAGAHALKDRRVKKRVMRRLWQTQLNAAVREHELNYSQFIHLLKTKKIDLDRKVLSQIAKQYPQVFKAIIDFIKK